MFISATACAAVPSRAYFDEGRTASFVRVTLAGHWSHILAEDGEQAAWALICFAPVLGPP
jgi:hypothetical protein